MKTIQVQKDLGPYRDPYDIFEAHVDPKYKDIVINGYGITKKQAKQIRDWLTKAMREVKR
jgi:hypothetical protein